MPNAEQAFSKCSFFLSFNFVTASENGFLEFELSKSAFVKTESLIIATTLAACY